MSLESKKTADVRDPITAEIKTAKSRKQSLPKERVKDMKIKELMEKMDAQKDQLLRNIAEMQTYIRTKEKDLEISRKTITKDLALKLMPVLDSIDAGIQIESHKPILEPLKQQLMQTLTSLGVTEMKTVGESFNPMLHEVISITQDGEENKVVAEIQKGYLFNNEVIRTSKVIVCKR
jgi:molecular chaperone GrpE